MFVEDRHTISVLTENVLYERIRAFNESDDMDDKTKEEKKKEAIEVFVKECSKKSSELSEEEVRELVNCVLNRTLENIKSMKDDCR